VDELQIAHVVPIDMTRGAQVEARVLVDLLDGRFGHHYAMTLFEAPPAALRPEVSVGAVSSKLRLAGFDPRALWPLRKQLAASPVDVLVCHGGESLKYLLPVLPTLRNRPAVVYRNIVSSRYYIRSRGQLAFNRIVLGRADWVVAISHRVAEESHQLLHIDTDRIVVIGNARDPEVYRPADTRRDGPVRMIAVGAFHPDKRPERYMELVSTLRQRGVDVEAAWAGEGALFDEMRPLAADAGVELLGRRNDVPALLQGSDIYVLTSRSEGMAGVLVEAAMAGLPIVTTDVEGAEEVVEDGVSGLIVGVDDRAALVDAVARLAADSELRRRMGAAARERAVERFSIEALAGQWINVLDRIVSNHPR
jgi:glycosyltransferase involved in cell wall biosynthesis